MARKLLFDLLFMDVGIYSESRHILERTKECFDTEATIAGQLLALNLNAYFILFLVDCVVMR